MRVCIPWCCFDGIQKFSQDFSGIALKEVDVPEPQEGDILIKVMASSVNPIDIQTMKGWLLSTFPISSLPCKTGFDVSGVVAKLGKGVSNFKIGDCVWVDIPTTQYGKELVMGAFAEYAIVSAAKVGFAPKSLSFIEAASIPVVGITSCQALKAVNLSKDDTILILGGSGGTGSMAIQLAKAIGAKVITTCSERNFGFCKKLGADECINYRKIKWVDTVKDVDAVYDCTGEKDVFKNANKVLKEGGKFVTIAAFEEAKNHKWERKCSGGPLFMDSLKVESLDEVAALMEKGIVKPSVGKVFTFDNVIDAIKESAIGHNVGKTCVDHTATDETKPKK